MFEASAVAVLASPLSHRREFGEADVVEALIDYEHWQRQQVLYGVGITSLIKISGGWLVLASPELVEKVIGF